MEEDTKVEFSMDVTYHRFFIDSFYVSIYCVSDTWILLKFYLLRVGTSDMDTFHLSMCCCPSEIDYEEVPIVTLMDILTHSEVSYSFYFYSIILKVAAIFCLTWVLSLFFLFF